MLRYFNYWEMITLFTLFSREYIEDLKQELNKILLNISD